MLYPCSHSDVCFLNDPIQAESAISWIRILLLFAYSEYNVSSPLSIPTVIAYTIVYGILCPQSNYPSSINHFHTLHSWIDSRSIISAAIAIVSLSKYHDDSFYLSNPTLTKACLSWVTGCFVTNNMAANTLPPTGVFVILLVKYFYYWVHQIQIATESRKTSIFRRINRSPN